MRSSKDITISLFVFFLIFSAFIFVWKSAVHTKDKPKKFQKQALITPINWSTEEWDADERPFMEAEQQIKQEIDSATDPKAVVEKYRDLIDEESPEPLTVFRWAYTCFLVGKNTRPFNSGDYHEPFEIMNGINNAHSYRFARLRFTMGVYFSHNKTFDDEVKLGKRLLKRNLDDLNVKESLSQILSHSKKANDNREAILLTNELMKQNSHKTSLYYNLGSVHYNIWSTSFKRENRLASIKAYHQFIKLSDDRMLIQSAKNTADLLENTADPLLKPSPNNRK